MQLEAYLLYRQAKELSFCKAMSLDPKDMDEDEEDEPPPSKPSDEFIAGWEAAMQMFRKQETVSR